MDTKNTNRVNGSLQKIKKKIISFVRNIILNTLIQNKTKLF